MSGHTPDFVVKKRRKRAHAVDPCLGFYPLSPRASTRLQIFTKQLPTTTGDDVPPIVTLSPVPSFRTTSDSTHTSSEVEDSDRNDENAKAVTVEEFLRRSTKKKPMKSYGGKKRKLADPVSDPEDFIPETSTSPVSQFVSSPDGKSVIMKKTRLSRKRKPKLAERLIRAAVLAHGNPTERLRRRGETKVDESSRQALHFVNEAHSLVKMSFKGRTETLVDPRKIGSFHESSFSARGSLPPSSVTETVNHKPVTRWKSPRLGFSGSSDSRRVKKKSSAVHDKNMTSTRIPLSFIPLKDAERAYSSKSTPAHRGLSSKLHLTEIIYPTKFRHTPLLLPVSQPQMHEIIQEGQTPDRPSKRVKFPSPLSSSANEFSNSKPKSPSVPISNPASQQQHDVSGSSVSAARYENSSAPRHGSLSDLSTAPHARTSDLSDDSKSRPRPKKPLKALASFLDSFLVTARNATQMQTEASSRSSIKRKKTKSVHPIDTDPTSNVPKLTQSAHETAGADEDSRTLSAPRLQPSTSICSFIQTSVRKPSSSVAEVARQPSSPTGLVLLRTLTARSRLLLKSVKFQATAAPAPSSNAGMLLRPRPNSHNAAYTNQLSAGQVAKSQPAPQNATSSPFRRPLHRSFVPNSHTLKSNTSSPQLILAALRPPKAQIVLSSTPTLAEDSSRSFPPICISDNSEQLFGVGTPDIRRGTPPRLHG